MDLGRYQQGEIVKISIDTVDADGNLVEPDSAPTVSVSDPDSNVIFSGKLALDQVYTTFSKALFVGLGFGLGRYTVTYSYQAGAFSGSGSDTFDVIPGGDPGGRVISLYAFDRPEAKYVVAHLTSGLILQGKNPRL